MRISSEQKYGASNSVITIAYSRFSTFRVTSEIVAGGGEAMASYTDVTSNEQVAAMVALALERYGKVDIMVNNAGTTHKSQPMLDVDEATFDRVVKPENMLGR